jgi:hypothetical protein
MERTCRRLQGLAAADRHYGILPTAPCPRPATTLKHDKWRELFDGPKYCLFLFFYKQKTSSGAFSWDE